MVSYPKSFKGTYIIASYSYCFISSALIKLGWSSQTQNKLSISNITIENKVLKNAEAFGGKTVCIIGKCKTNYRDLIIPNIRWFSPEPKKFSKSPNKKKNLKPSLALLAELKNDDILAVCNI